MRASRASAFGAAVREFSSHHLEGFSSDGTRPHMICGHAPGPKFREILNAVEDAQLEGRLGSRDAALEFVQEGDAIILDAGSTTLALAQAIKGKFGGDRGPRGGNQGQMPVRQPHLIGFVFHLDAVFYLRSRARKTFGHTQPVGYESVGNRK